MEIGNWSREKAEKISSENKLEKSVTEQPHSTRRAAWARRGRERRNREMTNRIE